MIAGPAPVYVLQFASQYSTAGLWVEDLYLGMADRLHCCGFALLLVLSTYCVVEGECVSSG